MSTANAQVTVGTTPTLLNTTTEKDSVYGKRIYIKNQGAADIFIGNATVAIGTGYKLAATDPALVLDLGPDDIYGIVATATQPAHILLLGV